MTIFRESRKPPEPTIAISEVLDVVSKTPGIKQVKVARGRPANLNIIRAMAKRGMIIRKFPKNGHSYELYPKGTI